MSKIKLSILLLISLLVLTCSNQKILNSNHKLSLGYIGGGTDGLFLRNLLESHLRSSDMYDPFSNYIVEVGISHGGGVFITNVDNTSDRENVSSTLSINIKDKVNECISFSFNETVDYFYIYASGETFLSNQKAVEEISKYNTETLIKKFITNLSDDKFFCLND
ncbi:hypothetical protein N9E32_00665 [Alphaproteobacteria bacterium]|nr:hypothetical protein [Alphaproteobacteria bacterium]